MPAAMTRDEREEFLNKNRDVITSILKRDYPREEVEEFVQWAIVQTQYREFPSEAAFMHYIKEAATFNAIRTINNRIRRKRALNGLPKHRPVKDTTRLIDWKIDLERAISKATSDDRLRTALWHHIYEGYTQEDIAEMTGKDQGTISRAIKEVRKIMRRGGYRDGVSSHV